MRKIFLILVVLVAFFIPLVFGATVNIDASTEYQTIDGFGGAESWKLPPASLYDDLFDELEMSILRFQMFAYTESDPDVIGNKARDNDNNDPFVIDWNGVDTNFIDAFAPLLQAAQSRGIKIIATTWSPPAWMKQSPYVENSSDFVPGNEDELVEWILIYVKGMEQRHGIHIDSVSIQNEPDNLPPWPGCKYTPAQITDIVKRLGARFAAEGVTTEIHAPDTTKLNSFNTYANSICSDPVAKGYVDVLAGHPYEQQVLYPDNNIAKWQSAAATASSCGKKFWQTEYMGASNQNSWNYCFAHAQHMHTALFYGNVNAFLVYELYNKGSVNSGLIDDDGKHCQFFSLKQYAKHIRPGAIRIGTSSNDNDVLVTSYKHNSDNTFTIVAINRKTSSDSTTFNINNLQVSSLDVYRTTQTENSENKGQVAVSGNSFTYNLPAESITTFTGTIGGVPPPQTCSDFGGICCQAGETCSGSSQSTTDCTNCCTSGICETPPPPPPPPPPVICADKILLHHFDNDPAYGESSSFVYDFSGNSNNGVCSGTNCPVWVSSSKFTGAFDFDGSNDYFIVSHNQFLNLKPDDFSISSWINLQESIVNKQYYLIHKFDTSPLSGFFIRIINNNINFLFGNGAGNLAEVETTNTPIQTNQWQHIAATYDGSQLIIYVNGQPQASSPTSYQLAGNTNDLGIGIGHDYASNYFNGIIDELTLWNHSLSPQEILTLYNSNTPVNCTQADVLGDVNGDGQVNFYDLIMVATDFGKTSNYNSRADTDGNQVIDIFDIVYVARRIT